MKRTATLLPLLGLASLLTHCALTDHYQLASDTAGVGSDAAGGNASGSSSGASVGAAGDDSIAGNPNGGDSPAGKGGASEIGGASGNSAQAGGAGMSTLACGDTTQDPKNCGACGNVCSTGRDCVAGACRAGWVGMSNPPSGFVARTKAAACAMGSDVFIWGGSDQNSLALDTGAIYSPATDTWTPVSKGAGMPSPRTFATAVWTGVVIAVYGGTDNSVMQKPLNSGAYYDPKTGIWTALPNGPTPRSQPLGYSDGERVYFWGGNNGPPNAAVAGIDRLTATGWMPGSGANDPGAVLAPAYAFDGSTLYLQGGILGNQRPDRVYGYTVADDKWATLSKSALARSSGFGVWDGSNFVVWGGNDGTVLHNDGKYMTGSTWTAMNTTGAPTARMQSVRRSGWGFQVKPGVSAILGGQTSLQNAALLSANGALYNADANQWKPLADWPSGEDHEYGVGVWTGTEFVLWSGHNGGNLTGTGERLAF